MSSMDPERRLTLVGILTWAIAAVPPLLTGALKERYGFVWLAAMAAFLVLFLLATHTGCNERQKVFLAILQSLAALTAVAVNPAGFEGVLLVVVTAELGNLGLRAALAWVAVQTVLLGVAFSFVAQHYVFVTLAYFTFQLFALFTTRIAHSEAEARLQLAAANAELKVAAGLLDISSRTSERLRIARDLHDLLGHHLTALTLNLEIASHVANGEAKEAIETSRSIAKRLLADTRDVVSRLREDEPVDLTAALAALSSVITAPALHLEVAPGVTVRDTSVAQIALRVVEEIITNAVRHSSARNLWVALAESDGALAISARDDGEGVDYVRFGNGLRGMRERVDAAHGSMEVSSMRGQGFRVQVWLPLGSVA
jgi:signal transduction histidine kinase